MICENNVLTSRLVDHWELNEKEHYHGNMWSVVSALQNDPTETRFNAFLLSIIRPGQGARWAAMNSQLIQFKTSTTMNVFIGSVGSVAGLCRFGLSGRGQRGFNKYVY